METIDLKIQGMTCGGCVKSVTRVLTGVAGVTAVDVSDDVLALARSNVERLGRGPRITLLRSNLAAAVEQVERELIQSAFVRAGGNVSETARLLGLTRRTMQYRLEKIQEEASTGARETAEPK